MQIGVTGVHGLAGSALVPFLRAEGHRVARFVRGAPQESDEIAWTPDSGISDPPRAEGLDAVIHLAGESIAGRWTEARKAEIRRSRVEGTRRLCESLARLARPPRVLLSASAVGFYGNRGGEMLLETSAPGSGFLADVCRGWEAATAPLAKAGVRVVHLRFGMMLSQAGGGLGTMLLPFRLGLGGKLGAGDQFMSWVALDDVLTATRHILSMESLVGPVNVVAPSPVTNAEFARTLAGSLHRPALLPAPAFALRLALGEMADEMLLASQRALPGRLRETGYEFRFPQLDAALRHLLASGE
ncbi:MAG TPA: TIGR01777 family oxidoreductase [Candidatus Sulfotelmatobacter sp.]|nr:TIGR01777 family oxidoreductase [Candidatus Sulfotelmatobacter sp.]